MKVCVNCGAELPDQAKFCAKCGTPASEPTTAAAATQTAAAVPTDQTITTPPTGGFTQAPGTGGFTQAPGTGNQTPFAGAGPVVPNYSPGATQAAPGATHSAPGTEVFTNANAPKGYTPSYGGKTGKSRTKKFSDFKPFDYALCGASLLLFLSCFLPAFSLFGITVNWLGSGLSDGATDGVFFIIIAILSIVFTFIRMPVANLVVGIICALLVLFEFFNASSQGVIGYTAFGFWLALFMLLALTVLNIIKFVKRNS